MLRDILSQQSPLPREKQSYYAVVWTLPTTATVLVVLSGWFIVQHVFAPALGLSVNSPQWLGVFGVTSTSFVLGYPLLVAAISHFNLAHFALNLARLLILTSYLETRLDWRWVGGLLLAGGVGSIAALAVVENVTGGSRVMMGSSGGVYALFSFVCFHVASLEVPFEARWKRLVRQSVKYLPGTIFIISVVLVFVPAVAPVAHFAHAVALVIGGLGWWLYTGRVRGDDDVPPL